MRTYSEAKNLKSYTERLEYLQLLDGNVESPRDISNKFYKSPLWLSTRKQIIARDLGQDIGVNGLYIDGPVLVHHINPITEEDIINQSPKLYDPENLICVSIETHNRIHYGEKLIRVVERRPGDTKLW